MHLMNKYCVANNAAHNVMVYLQEVGWVHFVFYMHHSLSTFSFLDLPLLHLDILVRVSTFCARGLPLLSISARDLTYLLLNYTHIGL